MMPGTWLARQLVDGIGIGDAFAHHFEETGNIDDISQAIFHYEHAFEIVPASIDIPPSTVSSLGGFYSSHFEYMASV